MSIVRFIRAVAVAFKNGAVSFSDYWDREHDPLTRDGLTRVFNRPQFERRRRRLRDYSLILLDIDDFKRINDQFGHSVGDRVLRAVAGALRTGSGDRVFRVGGEEFAVLLAGCAPADAVGVAERLRATVRELDLLDGRPVTVSAGVVGAAGLEHERAYRRADAALYRAKLAGRNRVVLWEPGVGPN